MRAKGGGVHWLVKKVHFYNSPQRIFCQKKGRDRRGRLVFLEIVVARITINLPLKN